MAGYKETPRQKMISMMYLVLTAMLALNVSKAVLEAFKIVNESLVITNENFTQKVDGLYNEFEKQYTQNTEKVAPFWGKAQEIQTISNNFISYIDSLKYETIRRTVGLKVGGEDGITYDSLKKYNLRNINKLDNYTIPTNFLINGELLTKGKGYELEDRINQYRENLLAFIPEEQRPSFNIGLITKGTYIKPDKSTTTDWVYYTFNETILAADVTIFNNIEAEAKNAEFDIVDFLYKDITAEDFKFSRVEARIVANSAYVFQGDEYKAEIFVAGVDEENNPTVEYKMGISEFNGSAGSTKIEGDKGIVQLSIPTRNLSPKEYSFAGRIIVKGPSGTEQSYPFNNRFTVAQPSANVAATKMNVFYRGVPNPIRISAAGIPDNKLDYSITTGTINKTAEGYEVIGLDEKTLKITEVTITIYALGDNRSRKKLGEQVFRLKDLPDPIVFARGMDAEEKISKGELTSSPFLLCELPEYANFDYKYNVTGFSMTAYKTNGESYSLLATGTRLTSEMLDYINKARRGTDIVFKNIKVKGPTGDRNVQSLALTIR